MKRTKRQQEKVDVPTLNQELDELYRAVDRLEQIVKDQQKRIEALEAQ